MSLTQPLAGIRVIEFEGIGPGPVAGRILASMGAEVTAIIRPAANLNRAAIKRDSQPLRANKQAVTLDLKQPEDVARALDLIAAADALIEGNRPGVMERLGLGPEASKARNPRLIYGRMTGWGQDGPLAQAAGHDLNYVALTGLLSLSARPGQAPIVPPTVIGDASGGLGLAFGIVCALLDVRAGGPGRIVDAAMVDISAMLGMLTHWLHAEKQLASATPSVFHDSPQYDVYECADGRYISIGALEPQFYALLLDKLGINDIDPEARLDTARWPALKARFAATFRTRSRDEWCAALEGSDVCFAPVLTLDEVSAHPHNAARGLFPRTPTGGIDTQVAPRFIAL